MQSTFIKDFKWAILAFLALAILLTTVAIMGSSHRASASTTDSRSVEVDRYKTFTFFSATSSSATSTNDTAEDPAGVGMDIKGANAVTLYFSRADFGGNTGTSTFSVQVSPDEGVTWYNFNKLISNTTNTNSQDLTRVSSVQIEAATSTTIVSMDLEHDAFSRVRCIVVETIDGSHTCEASAEF